MLRTRLVAPLLAVAVLLTGCATQVFDSGEPAEIPPPSDSRAMTPGGAGAASPAMSPVGVPRPLAPELRDLPPPAPPVGAPVGRWAVQVASIQDRAAAHEAQVGLAERAFPAYVLTYRNDAGTWYRVRVGPFGDRGSADAIAAALEDFGYSTWIVAEDE